MSAIFDQLSAVRDLVAIAGQRPSIGGKQVAAFVGYIDAETGLPAMGGGSQTERDVSLVALNDSLPEMLRDLPVVITPEARPMKVTGWEKHEGFTVIECR